VFGELAVGGGDGVLAEILLRDGEDLVARDHDRDDLALAVAFLDRAAGQEAEERPVRGRHREGAEGEAVAFDAGEDLADGVVGRDHRGVANHAVDMVLHAADFGDLVGFPHIIVKEAQSAIEGHRDGHAVLGDRVHIGRDDREG